MHLEFSVSMLWCINGDAWKCVYLCARSHVSSLNGFYEWPLKNKFYIRAEERSNLISQGILLSVKLTRQIISPLGSLSSRINCSQFCLV